MIYLQFIIKGQEVEFSLFVTFLVISFSYGEGCTFFKRPCKNIILVSLWQWSLCYLNYLRNLTSLAAVYSWIPLILGRSHRLLWLKPYIDVFYSCWIKVILILPHVSSDFIRWVFGKEGMIGKRPSFLCIFTFGCLKF